MFKTLYLKMTAYFLGIITLTLLAVTVLFAVTVGKPIAKDIHSLLRNHMMYLSELVMVDGESGMNNLDQNLERFTAAYGFQVAVFGPDRKPVFLSKSRTGIRDVITDRMIDEINRKGMFIQKGHFGKPVIYASRVQTKTQGFMYLILSKEFPELKVQGPFIWGLFVIGLVMMTAVYPLSRGISEPVIQLTHALEDMSNGNFNASPICGRNDEIGGLVRGYRKMSESVNGMIASKKKLMADMSHELCSPLARIRVGTELIKDLEVDSRTQRYVAAIENDIAFMDHLIGNLALYSRLNLPDFPFHLKTVCPVRLVLDVAERYEAVSVSHGIRIRLNIPLQLSSIQADPDQLKQVFTNLVDNALRYSDKGDDITIGAYEKDQEICFCVEDSGPGVPEKDEKKIFEPLYRADSARDPNSGGSGLGLAISARIMELHGGTLTYERVENKTRFVFCIRRKS